MKINFTKQIKDKLDLDDLPTGFDQRFFNKLEASKKEDLKPIKEYPTIGQRLMCYFAPMGLATGLGVFIILWTTTTQSTIDLEARTKILNNLQTEEVAELSTLSEKEWDQLLSAAD